MTARQHEKADAPVVHAAGEQCDGAEVFDAEEAGGKRGYQPSDDAGREV
ncbi:MAG TPA: hypothetical protein VKT82_12215 [Ktedonobacterales bacterium]|nr:hypothetical protein [Ktedonobacterales bacterium]